MPWDRSDEIRPGGASIGAQHDIRIEDVHEPPKVAMAGRRQEGIDDRPVTVEVGIGHRRSLDATSGPACELASGRWRPTDDRREPRARF